MLATFPTGILSKFPPAKFFGLLLYSMQLRKMLNTFGDFFQSSHLPAKNRIHYTRQSNSFKDLDNQQKQL